MFKRHGDPQLAITVTDEFLKLVKEFARTAEIRTIRMETRKVKADGSVPRPFLRFLLRLGFRPIYVGLEMTVSEEEPLC